MRILHYVVVEGGVDEVTELLKASWGKVCFTGSERVGKVRTLRVLSSFHLSRKALASDKSSSLTFQFTLDCSASHGKDADSYIVGIGWKVSSPCG
jgi:hypothetical protein